MTQLIRKLIGVVICLFFVLPQLEAQQIKYAEYFFDNDPGKGNASSVNITQADTLDNNYTISTSGLSNGIHFLFFRVKDTDLRWSLVNSSLIYITSSSTNSNISTAEYFFDNDPGKGNGISVSISSGSSIDIAKTIATSSLNVGIHFLYFRVKNADGLWSLTDSKLLYITDIASSGNITAAEYFFDNDPGIGSANSLSVTAGDTVNISSSISVSSISSGLHYLFVRVKDANGKWSLTNTQLLFKSEEIGGNQITNAEYFFDTDPGLGNANSITITSGDTINLTTIVNTTGLSAGVHNLYIRVKNNSGRWSLNSKRMLYIKAGELSSPKITQVEYFFDSDPGFGNGTDFNITSGNTIDITEIIASTNLSLGHHLFYVRAKDSLGRWSINDKRLVFVSPSEVNRKIVGIEYSVDTIMPFGQGNMLSITPTDSLDYNFTFTHGITDTFFHILYTRIKDAGNRWSLIDTTIFKLENCIIPTANFSINDICFGDSITISNTSTETDSSSIYEWDILNDGTIESNDSIELTYGFNNPGTYKVNLKVTNFVCIDTVIKTIKVFPTPDTLISLFGANTTCPTEFTVLSANNAIGNQYQWLKNGNLIQNANSNYYQAQDSGNYSVEITNLYNCVDTTISIKLNKFELPMASISNNGSTSFCEGDSIILNGNINTGLTYQWYKNGDTILDATNSTLVVKTAGDYKLEIKNTNGCSDFSSATSIVVNSKVSASISTGSATTFCQGGNVVIYASSGIGYSYQWFKNDTIISNANSSFYSADSTGNYKVLINNAYQCSDTSTAIDVIVNDAPISNINFNGSTTICQGDTVVLSASSDTGLSYQWKSYGTNLIGATDSIYNVLQTGNYTLVITNSNNCVTESAQQLVSVNPIPGASILPLSSTSFCFGDSVILQANTGAGLNYKWYNNNTLLNGDTNSSIIIKTTGNYLVEVNNVFNCSQQSAISSINTFPIPTSIFSLDNEICSSDTAIINYIGNATSGAFYNWNFGGATILSGTGQGPYSLQWNTAGEKHISLKVNENNCSSNTNFDTTNINTVTALITAPIVSACEGDSIILTANSSPNYSYQWMLAGTILQGDSFSTISISNTGLYSVLITDNSIGCKQMSSNKTITINTTDFNLNFSASTSNFTQPPFDVTFSNTTPNMNNYNFQWELGDGNTSTFYNPIHTYLYNGDYSVTLFAENSSTGCRDTIEKTDYISCTGGSPNPCNITAAISPAGPVTLCNGDSILLSASAGTNYTYQWSYNNMIIPDADSILFYAKQAGNYRVIISDNICNQTSPTFVLNHFPSIVPQIQSTGSIQPCTNDSLNLSLLVSYNSYSWSTGESSQSIYVNQTGYYQVTVTDNYGCNMGSSPFIVSNSFLNPPNICIVGVDSLNHNRLVWERQNNALIDSFYVYRESYIAGQFDKIGALDFSETSLFVDVNSNPAIQSYRYKIAAVDTCGGLTLLSDYHKTIHLTINAGLNGSWNLIWDGYEGFAFNSYRIYRGTNSNNMNLLTQLASTANSYTDLNPPTGTVYYQIEVVKASGCYPDTTSSKANTNYNTSRSNTANNGSIAPMYLTAEFSGNIQTGIWPIQVEFTDNSTGSPDNWHWNFGDGNSSIEQNPNHTYNNTGIYTVSLVACNGNTCDTITKTDYIEVLPNGMVEIGVEMSAKLYPNPNDGSFTIEINDKGTHKLELHIYNNIGSEVFFDKFSSSGNTSRRINLQTLSNGVYYVHLNTKSTVVYRGKVVINK